MLGLLAATAHFALYWLIDNDITAFQRACLGPNDLYAVPIDDTYIILMWANLACNALGMGMCIILYIWLWAEDKDSQCRNHQHSSVSIFV